MSLRVRIVGNTKAYITVKGARFGASRSEFEYPVPLKDARALMKLRTGSVIEKRRYVVNAGHARYEVDVFKGVHRKLVTAEIELPSERARFERPVWLGKEVTGEERYDNVTLASL